MTITRSNDSKKLEHASLAKVNDNPVLSLDRTFRVVGIGEILWDFLPSGKQMGGAPANFACHARFLGASASVISRVGNDDHGREIFQGLEALGVSPSLIEVDWQHPTGTVIVDLSEEGHPGFMIPKEVAWDFISPDKKAFQEVRDADAICFGTLAQRSEQSRKTIHELLEAAPVEALRVFDVNMRQRYLSPQVIEDSLFAASILKINESEFKVLAELLRLPEMAVDCLPELAERYDLKLVAYTRGANGSLLYSEGEWADHPGISILPRDTVGAGDSFTAAATLGFLCGASLDKINSIANEVAVYVCSCNGATPVLPSHFRKRLWTASGSRVGKDMKGMA